MPAARRAYCAAAARLRSEWYRGWNLGKRTCRLPSGGAAPGVWYLSVSVPPARAPYTSSPRFALLGAHASARWPSNRRSRSEKSFWMEQGGGTPRRADHSAILATPQGVSLLRPQARTAVRQGGGRASARLPVPGRGAGERPGLPGGGRQRGRRALPGTTAWPCLAPPSLTLALLDELAHRINLLLERCGGVLLARLVLVGAPARHVPAPGGAERRSWATSGLWTAFRRLPPGAHRTQNRPVWPVQLNEVQVCDAHAPQATLHSSTDLLGLQFGRRRFEVLGRRPAGGRAAGQARRTAHSLSLPRLATVARPAPRPDLFAVTKLPLALFCIAPATLLARTNLSRLPRAAKYLRAAPCQHGPRSVARQASRARQCGRAASLPAQDVLGCAAGLGTRWDRVQLGTVQKVHAFAQRQVQLLKGLLFGVLLAPGHCACRRQPPHTSQHELNTQVDA